MGAVGYVCGSLRSAHGLLEQDEPDVFHSEPQCLVSVIKELCGLHSCKPAD